MNGNASKPVEALSQSPSVLRGVLFFDLETVPDYDRQHLFELDEIPAAAVRMLPQGCPPVDELLKGTLDDFKQIVSKLNPVDDVLDAIDAAEKQSKKPRKGVFDLTAELRKQDEAREKLLAEQRKKMAVTPEFNRIVAMGWSLNGERGEVIVDGKTVTEQDLLIKFWEVSKSARVVSGYNVLNFDLPVIFVRSILLDVSPSRTFDTKPWSGDVVDLMVKRFPRTGSMRLKLLCRTMGIEVPAGDVEGSQVEDLFKAGKLDEIAAYVRSDVAIVEKLFVMYRGFFF